MGIASLVFHQDFAHHFTPWIHLVHWRLRDHFEFVEEVPRSQSVVFRCVKAISPETVDLDWGFDLVGDNDVNAAFEYSMKLVSREKLANVAAAKVMWYIHQDKLDDASRVLADLTISGIPLENELLMVSELLAGKTNRTMKKVILTVLTVFIFGVASHATAQSKKTIILVRHAEKAPAVEGDKGDVDLSSEGRDRAMRFANVVKRFRPGEIFATAYKRTQQAAEPIAKLRGKTNQTFDASKHPELIDLILKSKTKRFVIVGHSNTVPFLANLLAKKEVFKQLPDTEYGVVWVIRITNGVFRKMEVYPY